MNGLQHAGHRLSSFLVLFVLVGGLVLAACGAAGGSPTSGTGGTGGGQTATTGGNTPATGTGGQTTTTGGTGSQTATTGGTTPTTAAATGNTQTTATTPTTAGAQATGTTTTGGTTTTTTGTQTTAMTPPSQGTSTGGGNSGNQGSNQLGSALMGGGADQPGAVSDATLTLNLGSEIDTGDPQVMAYLNEIAIASKVYAPLLALDPDNNVVANVAESMTVSKDGKTYTFKLRKTSYTDGKPVTAKDYAYAIKRACSPEVNGNYSNILYAIAGCEDWRGSKDNKLSAAKTEQAKSQVHDSIKALDDYTLQIKLQQAAGYFPYVMATWVTYPVRQDLVEGKGANWWKDAKNYIGNGPFKLKSWEPKKQWTFVRNDDYFLGKPGIQTLIYKEIDSPQTELLAYKQSEFDMIGPSSTLLNQIMADSTLKDQLVRTVGANTWWVSFNMSHAPFDKQKVRQAFAMAMNRQQYIDQIQNGLGKPAGQLLYPGIAGYETKYEQKYDPDQAQKLLAEAGYPNGKGFPKLSLYYASDDTASKQRATFWAQQFSQVLNVNIQPVPVDAAELQHMETNRDPKLTISFRDWYEDYPHPQDWLSLVFANNSTRAPIGWNDPHFNELVNKADKLPLDQAKPLYEEAETYLAKQAPAAFYVHNEGLTLTKPYVKGCVKYPTDPCDMRYSSQKIYMVKK